MQRSIWELGRILFLQLTLDGNKSKFYGGQRLLRLELCNRVESGYETKYWQKTKLSKVIQNCIGFSALRSMIGLWNSRHPPDQSDPALKSITPGSLSISRVFQRLSEVVQKSLQFLIDSNCVGVLSKPKFLQVDTHFTFCDGFYRKTCWFRQYNHSVFPN